MQFNEIGSVVASFFYDQTKGLPKRLCRRAACVGRSGPNSTSFLVLGMICNEKTCVAHIHTYPHPHTHTHFTLKQNNWF